MIPKVISTGGTSTTLLGVALIMSITLIVLTMNDVSAAKYPYKVELSGQNEVPPVQTSATGLAEFTTAENDTMKYRINATGVSEASGITSAHIYSGAEGQTGQVLVDLWNTPESKDKDTAYGVIFRGNITESLLKGTLQGKTLSDLMGIMDSGDAYVNIHTSSHPDGEIRGQLNNVDAPSSSANSTVGLSTLTE